jgi:formylglycine-generating enzyme required for sulfatase activity
MAFVRVLAGEFWMGSDTDDPEAFDDEMPAHRVTIGGRFTWADTR